MGVTKLLIPAGLFLLASTSLSIMLSGVEALSQPVFGPPVNLGPRINTASHEGDPFLTADGRKLFFSDGADIWFSERTGSNWTQAIRLGPQINYFIFLQTSPSVSPDGQKLYYVDAERGGTYWDIWVSTWDSSINDWGTPQNLGYPVNSPGEESSARIGPDGRHLYFSSLSSSASRCGLYVSEWDGTSWSAPQPLGAVSCNNAPDYPSISANGLWLYFHQSVNDGLSTFVTSWKGSNWGPPFDLRQDLGGNTSAPYITPTGDSLFFSGCADFPGFGGCDIWMAKRLPPGDLNLDSQLTPADAVLEMNKVFLGEPYPAPARLGDLNCDTRFSPADVALMLRLVYAGVPPSC